MPLWLDWSDTLFSWVLRASWQGSVLVILVVLTQRLLRKVLNAQWRYALWLIVLARLVLPEFPQTSISVFNLVPSTLPAVSLAPIPGDPTRGQTSTPSTETLLQETGGNRDLPTVFEKDPLQSPVFSRRFDLGSALPLLWLTGALVLLFRVWRTSYRFSAHLRTLEPVQNKAFLKIAGQCASIAGLGRVPVILETEEVESPALFGTLRPKVLLPEGMVQAFSPDELRYVLLHEFYHLRRRDVLQNWALAFLQILHWFNPVIWLAFNRLRSDRELVVDAKVLSDLPGARPVEYGNVIIKLLEQFADPSCAPGLVSILEKKHQMRRRIAMISGFRKIARRSMGAAALALAALGMFTLTDASSEHGPEPGSWLTVRAMDASTGLPIEGATVASTCQTDRRGFCRVPLPSFPARVRASAQGYIPRFVIFWYSSIVPQEYTFLLRRGEAMGGVVHDDMGNPVADAEVYVSGRPNLDAMEGDAPQGLVARTDGDGRWVSRELPRSPEFLDFGVLHAGHAPSRYTWGTDKSKLFGSLNQVSHTVQIDQLIAREAVFVLNRGFRVVGVVRSAVGNPIPGATLGVTPRGGPGPPVELRTGQDGRFELQHAFDGLGLVSIEAKGYLTQTTTVKLSRGMTDMTFVLKRGVALRGRILDEQGLPVAGATITSPESSFNLNLTTDADGRFVWDSAPERPLILQVDAGGFVIANEAFAPGEKENELRLQRLRKIRLTGRVVDAHSRAPIPRFRVSVSTTGTGVGRWALYRPAVIGSDGQFTTTFEGSSPPSAMTLVAGNPSPASARHVVGIRIEADGYYPDSSHQIAIEDGDTDLEFALQPGAGVSGRVVLPDGKPAEGAIVLLGSPGETPAMMYTLGQFSREELDGGLETSTDQSGRFSFPPMQKAQFVAVSSEQGYAVAPVEDLPAHLSIRLQPWGRVSGTLRMADRPGADRVVELMGTSSGFLRLMMAENTGPEGEFEFSRVPSGNLRLTHIARSGNIGARVPLQTAPVQVESGKTTTVRLGGVGRPLVGKLVIDAVMQNHFPLVMLQRSVSPSDPGYRSFVLDPKPDGSFRLEDVPAGRYELSAGVIRGRFTRDIVVPEMPAGRSAVPLDLGTIDMR